MKFVFGLGGAAGVQVLDDMRAVIQHQNHLALELEGQDRLHSVGPAQMPSNRGCCEAF